MKLKLLLIAAAPLALALSACTTTDTNDGVAAAPTAPASENVQSASNEGDAEDRNKEVCKRIAEMGSRLKKRICRPQWEWDALEEEARELTRDETGRVGSGAALRESNIGQ